MVEILLVSKLQIDIVFKIMNTTTGTIFFNFGTKHLYTIGFYNNKQSPYFCGDESFNQFIIRIKDQILIVVLLQRNIPLQIDPRSRPTCMEPFEAIKKFTKISLINH